MRRLISWIQKNFEMRQLKRNTRRQLKVASIIIITIFLVSLSGILYAHRDQAINKLHQLGADAGLKLRHIKVRGRSHIEKDTLRVIIHV